MCLLEQYLLHGRMDMENNKHKIKIPKVRNYAQEVSDKLANARKFNPTMSNDSFMQALNKAYVPGNSLTDTQRAMMPKTNKRIIDLTSKVAEAEVKNREGK